MSEFKAPEGWKLVPIEPTHRMLANADGFTDLIAPYPEANTLEGRRREFICAWTAMLDSVPPLPTVSEEKEG